MKYFLNALKNSSNEICSYEIRIRRMANIRSFAGISVSGIQELFGCTDGAECKVGLQTHHNTFVVAEDNGEANANGDKLDIREIFSVNFIGEDSVQFKGNQGKYLVAEMDGTVMANRDSASNWETWIVEDTHEMGLAFKSDHGKYLVAESNGSLNANRDVADIWEIFKIVHPNGNNAFLI